jgi:hypothetical protein
MTSLNGIENYINNSLSGLNNAYFDDIQCNTFINQPKNYFTGVLSNIQQQINNIASTMSNNIPVFTIGTVSNLPAGSTPTVSVNNSNISSPILSFGLVQGIQGIQGIQGQNGKDGKDGQGDSVANSLAIASLGLTVAGIASDLSLFEASTTTALTTIEGEISTLQGEVATLQEQTHFISSDELTETTIASNVNIGSIGLIKTSISSTSGEISTLGQVKVNNLITLGTDGSITGNSLSVGDSYIDNITTSNTSTQNINGSTVNIGYNGSLNTVNIGNYNTAVYVNGVLLVPFSSASSFFNQW